MTFKSHRNDLPNPPFWDFKGKEMKPFSLLVKPVGGACNLECAYCFYRQHPAGAIDRKVLERAISTYCALPFAEKSIALQGGEPLLAPSWVLDVAESCDAELSLQTNATLITPELAERLTANRWLVGASIDGPREIHDSVRGEGSFDAAVRGVRSLEAAGADYNLLTVVSRANVAKAAETYRFLRDNFATRYHQYIECTGPQPEYAITGEEWGEFLVALFDEWAAADSHTVSVRLFESLAAQFVRGEPLQCSFARHCRHHLVLEHDGSVYPCDFHVRDDLRLGNILHNSWEEMVNSAKYRDFADAKANRLPQKCRTCRFLELCNGDCPRNRQTLCAGWRRFFDHAADAISRLAIDALAGNML